MSGTLLFTEQWKDTNCLDKQSRKCRTFCDCVSYCEKFGTAVIFSNLFGKVQVFCGDEIQTVSGFVCCISDEN